MKNNILYPIITSAILAFIGFILHIIGFDFKGLVSCYDTFLYYKEIIFVAVSFVIIISVIIYDAFKDKLDKKKLQVKETKDEVDSLNSQLHEAKENLAITKQKLDEMIKIDEELRAIRALNNFKNGN